MKNMDIYQIIKNPIESEDFIDKLFEAYVGSMNDKIRELYQDSTIMYRNTEEYNKLYASVFNNWKRIMTTRTIEEWNELIRAGKVEKDILVLAKYLKNISDVETKEEAKKILRSPNNEQIKELMYKYGCYSYSMNTGEYLQSHKTTAFKDEKMKVEHRLYINIPGEYLHKFIRTFINECRRNNLPYYVKYYEVDARDDSFIVYTDTRHLLAYIKLLQEMEKKYPNLIGKTKTPPLLTGKINRWIGYGSEPLDRFDSFNGKRSSNLEWVMDTATKHLYGKKENKKKFYKGHFLTYGEYAGLKLYEDEVAKAKEDKEFSKDKKYLCFSGKDLSDKKYMSWLKSRLMEEGEKVFNAWMEDKWYCPEEIERNGQRYFLGRQFFIYYLKKEMTDYIKSRPDKVKILMEIIKESAEDDSIDPEKYCFDIENVKLLQKEDERLAEESNQTINIYTYKAMSEEEIKASQKKLGYK